MGQGEPNTSPQDPLRGEAIQKVRDELKARDPNFYDKLDKLPDHMDKLKLLRTMQRIFWTEPTTLENVPERVVELMKSLNCRILVIFGSDPMYYSLPVQYVCEFNAFGVQYLVIQ